MRLQGVADFQVKQQMLKFHLQIDWLLIAYLSTPSKNHSIHILMQNQQGEQLIFERKIISIQQSQYELESLSPFQFYMIVGPNKQIYCPFRIQFVSKLAPPVVRKIDLQLTELFNHYLNHQLFADIQPLIEQFAFQSGELTYRTTILEVETVTDAEEFSHLKSLLTKSESVQSEIKLRGSQLTTQDYISKETSIIMQECPQNQNKQIPYSISVQILPSAKKIKTFHSMASMSFEEITSRVEKLNQKRKHQFQRQRQIYQTNLWYLKFGKKGQPEQEEEVHSGWSMKVKMLVLLILLGLSLILGHLSFSNSKKIVGPAKQRRQKKSKHVRTEKRSKISSNRAK